jgi:hypothetical protein
VALVFIDMCNILFICVLAFILFLYIVYSLYLTGCSCLGGGDLY